MQNRILIAAAAAVLLVACGRGSGDISVQNAVGNATVPPGTVVAPVGASFFGKLSDRLATKTSKDGDRFTLAETKGGALAGAIIDGHVVGVISAAPARKPNMTLVFDDIRLADGTKEMVDVAVVSHRQVDPKTHRLSAIGSHAPSQAIKTDITVPAGATIELRFLQAVTSTVATASPG